LIKLNNSFVDIQYLILIIEGLKYKTTFRYSGLHK